MSYRKTVIGGEAMVGSLIKDYLHDHGLKQKSIAEKSRIPLQTFNAILNEQRKLEVGEYFRICNAIGESVDYFANKCIHIEVERKSKENEVS